MKNEIKLLNCEKQLEKKYQQEINKIMETYPEGNERDLIIKNLQFQKLANTLALNELFASKNTSNSKVVIASC